MNRFLSTCAAAAVFATGVVWAAPAKNEAEAKTAIEARSQHFKDMGKAMEPIGNMLRKKAPYDGAVAEKQAAQLAEMSKKIPSLFEVDTREFKAVKTEALDGIWTSQADFKAKSDDLTKAATALAEASKGGGDAASFTKNAAAVGKACGTCHDSYRVKKSG
jgi:cytochrome c556